MTTARLRRVEDLTGVDERTPVETLTPVEVCTRAEDISQTAVLAETDDLAQLVGDLLMAIPSARVLEKLSLIDPYALTPALRIDFLSALERQDGWLFALKQRAITAVAGAQASVGEGALFGVDEA